MLIVSHCGYNLYIFWELMALKTFSYVYCPFIDILLKSGEVFCFLFVTLMCKLLICAFYMFWK